MNDFYNKSVMAKNIQYYMELRGKTRNDLCSDLNIKYTTLTDWIKGKSYPRIDKIELLANYFQVEKSDLVEDKTKQRERPYEDIELLIARNGKSLSTDEKLQLIKMLSDL